MRLGQIVRPVSELKSSIDVIHLNCMALVLKLGLILSLALWDLHLIFLPIFGGCCTIKIDGGLFLARGTKAIG